jgi:hypothetical protein
MEDYINSLDGKKWLAMDITGDGIKEIFGYMGGSSTGLCPPDNIYWHTSPISALGGFMLKYYYSSNNIEKQLLVCDNNGLAVYSSTRNIPANPDISCS